MTVSFRSAKRHAHSPKRSRVTVLRTNPFQPFPAMTHEIPKSFRFLIECIPQERKISAGQAFNVPLRHTTGHLRKQQSQDKGACIVIGAIPFPIIRHVENSMLENSRVIGHPKEVIEL